MLHSRPIFMEKKIMKAEIFNDVHKTLKLMYKVQHSSNEFHYNDCV